MPTLLPGANVEEESHSYVPIIVDGNGNLYTVTESNLANNNQPRMLKSTDDGATWAEMDAANRPGTDTGSIADLESGWLTYETGGYATFTWQRSYPAYSRFRTSDHPTNPDTWVSNTREQAGTGEGSDQFMSHTSPTDQTYQWLFFGNGAGSDYRLRNYDGTYGTQQTLAAAALGPVAWLDDNDVSHVLYKASGELHYRTLTSAGSLSAATRVDANGAANGVNACSLPHTRPVPFADGADTIVTAVYANAQGGLRAVDIVNGTPGSIQTITDTAVTIDPPNTGNAGAVLSADVDGTTVHVVWSDSTTGDVLHSERPYGGAWTTPQTLASPADGAWWLYCSVIEHGGGKVLSLRYSDGFDLATETNDIYYDEMALATVNTATGSHTWTGTATGSAPRYSDWSAPVDATTPSGTASGSATGAWTFGGTATGRATHTGQATGAHTWAGSATGEHAATGSASGTWAASGSATGATEHRGTATGSHTWSGSASGTAQHSGSASGSHTWDGSATGATGHSGSATGSHGWSGTATGSAPTVGSASGSASGAWSFTGSATGATLPKGTVAAAHTWDGTATGSARHAGTATGAHAWTGSATSTVARDLRVLATSGPYSPTVTTAPGKPPVTATSPGSGLATTGAGSPLSTLPPGTKALVSGAPVRSGPTASKPRSRTTTTEPKL